MLKNKNAVIAVLFLALSTSSRIRAQELNWDRGVDLKAMAAGSSGKYLSAKATLVSDGASDSEVPSPNPAVSPLYELEQATSGDAGINMEDYLSHSQVFHVKSWSKC